MNLCSLFLHPNNTTQSAAIRRDRPTPPRGGGARGGGLVTFVKEDIPFRVVQAYSGDEQYGTECLAVEIQLSQGRRFTLVNIYRAPNRDGGQGRPGFDHIRVPVIPFVMAGDWNAHSPFGMTFILETGGEMP